MASRRLPFSPLRFCVFLSFLAGEGQRWGGMGEQFRSVANEPELAGRSPLNEESACRGSGGRGVDAVSAHGRSRHLLSPFCVAAVAQDREQLCTLSHTLGVSGHFLDCKLQCNTLASELWPQPLAGTAWGSVSRPACSP